MKARLLTLICALASISLPSYSQEENKQEKPGFWEKHKEQKHQKRLKQDRYITQGTAAMLDMAYDTKMSPLIYRGFGLAYQTGQTTYDPRFLNIDRLDLMAGALSGADLFSQFTPRFMASNAYLKWLTDSTQNYRIALGGGLRYGYTARVNPTLENSTYSHDIFGSLMTSFYIDKAIKFQGKNFVVDAMADLDLLSLINRHPGYTVIGTFATYLRPIGGFTHFSSSIGITFPLSKYTNENRYRIGYTWDMYGMAEFDRTKFLRMANHRFGITYYFKH